MRRFLQLSLLALLALGGCAQQAEHPAQTPTTTAAPEPAAPTEAPPPPAKPPAPKPPVPKPLPKPSSNPEELVGLDQEAVARLLGDPAESRDEGGARVLTYRTHDCQLDVILFLDVKTGVNRVLSFEINPTGGRRGKACYTDLRGGR